MDKKCKDLIETLEELSPYTSMILSLLDLRIKEAMFHSYKYHSEEYYDEVIRLKKIRNLLAFVLM